MCSLITIPTRLENYDSSKACVKLVKFLFTVGRMNDLFQTFSFRCSGTANGLTSCGIKMFLELNVLWFPNE